MYQRVTMIYIYIKFHEILFDSYLVMAEDERNDGQMEGRTDMEKTISLRLRRGIILNVTNRGEIP